MKLTAEDEYRVVTIESKATGLPLSEVIRMFRGIAMALEYHPESVMAQMPDEHELDEIISDAIKSEKSVDTNEGLTEYTP